MSIDHEATLVIGYLVNATHALEFLEVHAPEESHTETRYDEMTGEKRSVKVVDQSEETCWKWKEELYSMSIDGLMDLTRDLSMELGENVQLHLPEGEDLDMALISFSLTIFKRDEVPLRLVAKSLARVEAFGKRLKKLGFPIRPVTDAKAFAVHEAY